MISCSDTRLEPSRLFSLEPGDVFSIRNVANLVPSYSTVDHPCETAAGLEFAVTKLQVPHVVVLGHSHCNTKPVLGDMEDGWRYTPGLPPKIAPVFGLSCAKTWRAQWLTFTHSSGW